MRSIDDDELHMIDKRRIIQSYYGSVDHLRTYLSTDTIVWRPNDWDCYFGAETWISRFLVVGDLISLVSLMGDSRGLLSRAAVSVSSQPRDPYCRNNLLQYGVERRERPDQTRRRRLLHGARKRAEAWQCARLDGPPGWKNKEYPLLT